MKKFRFQWVYVFAALTSMGSIVVFQNCSKTNFTSTSASNAGASDSAAAPGDSNPSNTPPQVTIRQKTIIPTSSETANPGKVKALIVIDNSGSMGGSQQNLSATITPLLSELEKYNADIRIASTTFGNNECSVSSDQNCRETSLFSHTNNYSIVDNADGTKTQTQNYWHNQNPVIEYQFKQEMSQIEKDLAKRNLTDRINSFGTKGSNNESPFAAIVINTIDLNFFKQNDKALIFVVTDEDDVASIAKLIEPKTQESRRVFRRTTVPGIVTVVSGFAYSGQCTTQGENGSRTDTIIGPIISQTMEGCRTEIAKQTNCSLNCFAQENQIPSNGEGSPIGSSSYSAICDENRNFYTNQMPHLKFERCIPRDASVDQEVSVESNVTRYAAYHEELGSQTPVQQRNHFVQKLKQHLMDRVGEKYLIQVATNIPNQSCGLTGEYQSNDRFFQSIANQFPTQNYKLSSICSADGTSTESIKKLASDFISVVNSEYALGLLPNERVISARLKLKNSADYLPLAMDVQYAIRNGQFVLLDPSLIQFEKIEIEIRAN